MPTSNVTRHQPQHQHPEADSAADVRTGPAAGPATDTAPATGTGPPDDTGGATDTGPPDDTGGATDTGPPDDTGPAAETAPSAASAAGDGGDLGRRVAFRRHALGLSRAELAARAHMSPGYLQYVEEQPAQLTPRALNQLANALGTTVAELLGEGRERAPGRGRGAAHPIFGPMDHDECVRLLARGGVGRLVLVSERGPVALPVNFAVLDGDVIFCTTHESTLATAEGRQAGFEVDQVDEALLEGWSVLVTGPVRRISDLDELARVQALPFGPWAGGPRDLFLRVAASEITGRRIRVAS